MNNIEFDEYHMDKFEDCLNENEKIFLSAIFGKGKTTFIKEFFKNENYLSVVLNPILYSVHSNDDIFKLIEFDIAYEVFKQIDIKYFDSVEIPKEWYLQQVLRNKGNAIVEIAMEWLEKTNKNLHPSIIAVVKLFNEAKNIPKDLKNFSNYSLDKWDMELSKLLNNCPNRGNLFNNITSDYLKKITNKKKVLIIDDLDRMDPQHIFRILNVFSNSLFEDINGSGVHKRLGFDKIVLVGSHVTIRGIYEHVYGRNANFDGYFKKFYDEIFDLNFYEEVCDFLDVHLHILDLYPKKPIDYKVIQKTNLEEDLTLMIKDILILFYRSNLITWRDLNRVKDNPISTKHFPLEFSSLGCSPFITVVFYLKDILGTADNLLRCISFLNTKEYELDTGNLIKYKNIIVKYLLVLILGHRNLLNNGNPETLYSNWVLDSNESKYKFNFQFENDSSYGGFYSTKVISINPTISLEETPFFLVLDILITSLIENYQDQFCLN